MSDITRIDVCDGKYSVVIDRRNSVYEALRHGESWRDLVGDNLIAAMFDEIVDLRQKVQGLQVMVDMDGRQDGKPKEDEGQDNAPR